MLKPEPIPEQLHTTLAESLHNGEPVAVATIVAVEGSTPRGVGAQMLVWPSGRTLGSIGGGAVEAQVVAEALAALVEARSVLREYSLQAEEGALGVCGGRVQVFLHVLQPRARLVIAGAGHVAQPLAQLAAQVGFRVLVVDDRPEFLQPERFPAASTQLVSFAEFGAEVALDAHTAVVIVTRSHEHDDTVLRQVLDLPLAYLGVMGSRGKVRRMFQRLREEGRPAEELERVHAPIGLDVRAETPAELAVSIIAEVLQATRGGSGLPLSARLRAEA